MQSRTRRTGDNCSNQMPEHIQLPKNRASNWKPDFYLNLVSDGV